jgi:hypothetical protein
MKATATVEGLQRLTAAAGRIRGRYQRVSVAVGYSAVYAVRVHEDLQMRHTNGQAKFLEQPAREQAAEVAAAARQVIATSGSLLEGLKAGGQALLGYSQPLVPVDTGRLRGSGYVRVEG